MPINRKIKILILILPLLCFTSYPQELISPNDTGKLLIKKWTTEDGLPQNSVTSIVQTADGYLWLGTFGGLARFDGIKFTIFDSANSPGLTNNRVITLFEDSWHKLWVGTENGEVFVYSEGGFRELKSAPDFKREIVLGFQQDGSGHLYIASRGGLEKFQFDSEGHLDPAGTLLMTGENTIFKDADQKIWVNANNKFLIADNGNLTPSQISGAIPADAEKICFTNDQKIFTGGGRSFGVIENGNYRKILSTQEPISRNYFDLTYKNGVGWFQEKNYLLEWSGSKAIKYDLGEYVDGGSRAIFIDQEDNLWLGTTKDGLIKISHRRIGLLSDLTKSSIKNTYSVIEDSKGTVWIAGLKLFKIENGQVTQYSKLRPNGTPVTFRSLAIDGADNLWVGEDWGLSIFRNEKFVPVPQFKDIKIDAIFFDREGTLWAGGSQGLYRFKDGELRHFTTADGLVHDKVAFITQLRDGRLGIGTVGGMSIWKDDVFENYTVSQGISANNVRDIFEDEDGTIWIGTYGGGINRWHQGKFAAITKEQGLHDNFVSRILADHSDRFWILGNRGVFVVGREDLKEIAEGRRKTLFSAVYGTDEELKYSEGSGGHQPAGFRTKNGKMWFPLIEDMVVIDPSKPKGIAPRVIIERAASKTGGNELQTILQLNKDSVIEIEDGLRNLEIEYTGLSFTKPEKIRFFYKLDGLDEDWVDAGTRRTAFYPYLPSGEYSFQVKSVTIDGDWSESPAVIKINVAKRFWQTNWFIALLVLTAAAILLLIYWIRVKQMERQQQQQQEFSKRLINAHENERRRIATELHDGLGQNLLIIKNWALNGLSHLTNREQVREHFEKISETAANSLDETRSIVGNLSPQNLKRFGLTEAISNMAEQIEESSGMVFVKTIENIDGIFPDEAEISIYRIVQECLNNIVKHSESPRGEIRISRFSGEIEIMIRDFGIGFETEKSISPKKGSRGFGLQSITQRTHLLGGELRIDSKLGEGTVKRIRIKV